MTAHSGTSTPPARAQLALNADLTTLIEHPVLSSDEEVALDAVLAASVCDWDVCHAHDVPLSALLPDSDPSLLPAGFCLGTVLVRDGAVLGVIDVGHGRALRDEDRRAQRVTVRRMLKAAGIAVHVCNLSTGLGAIHALHKAAGWVVTRVGRGSVLTVGEVRALVVKAHAEAVVQYGLPQVTPLLRMWQRQLGPTELTVEHYGDRVEDMCESDHPDARSMPTAVALQRMLDNAGVTLAAVTGGPMAARVRDGAAATRVRQPPPARRFVPWNWPLFQFEWDLSMGVERLVSEHCVVHALWLDSAAWSAVADDLEADATVPAHDASLKPSRYFEPSRAVEFLVERGLLPASEAALVLEELQVRSVCFL
jgi:hypothetical protein